MTATTRHLARAALSAVLLLATMPPAASQDGDPRNDKRFEDWVVRCKKSDDDPTGKCALVQEAQRKSGDKVQRIMATVVGRSKSETGYGVLIIVPLGVFLPGGVTLKVDGSEDAKVLPFQICNKGGCRAGLRFDKKWLGRFKAGLRATATIQTAQGRNLTIPISLKGFSKGLASLATP